MKKFLLAGVALVALSGAAAAADLTNEPAPAPEPVVTNSAFDWTGFYVGVHGGAAFANFSGDLDGIDTTGGVFGAQAGYNYQFDHWVVGVETDFAYTSVDSDDASAKWLGTTTLRGGYAFDNLLLYAKGGVAYGELKDFDNKKWSAGWTAGAGVEYAFTKNITGRLEYDYVDLSKKDFDNGDNGGLGAHEILAGLNYKF